MDARNRILGFDLARAYAIFGMYIVNYNVVFGDYNDTSLVGKLLTLFSGNSSTVFVMLAGMGVALRVNKPNYSSDEKRHARSILIKRAWFLLIIGLLLSLWWPADILHFYAIYMFIAAQLLFVDKTNYLYVATIAVAMFHLLVLLIPYESGWNFETLQYSNFWTVKGLLRNTFYNGWNSVFPWLSFFTLGMYLGKLDWTMPRTQLLTFYAGIALFGFISLVKLVSNSLPISEDVKFFINADYLPPFLPFVLSTLGFGLMLIAGFMYISKSLSGNRLANSLAKTGQMTLTHYLLHLTIGMIIFAGIRSHDFNRDSKALTAVPPMYILLYAAIFFLISVGFSNLWSRKFKYGPFELLMRRISG